MATVTDDESGVDEMERALVEAGTEPLRESGVDFLRRSVPDHSPQRDDDGLTPDRRLGDPYRVSRM